MAQIYIHSEGLRQHIIRLEEEIQHIQKFIGLVESCKEYDTMHQRELREMQEILEHMEINLKQMHSITENILVEYNKIEQGFVDELRKSRQDIERVFENLKVKLGGSLSIVDAIASRIFFAAQDKEVKHI